MTTREKYEINNPCERLYKYLETLNDFFYNGGEKYTQYINVLAGDNENIISEQNLFKVKVGLYNQCNEIIKFFKYNNSISGYEKYIDSLKKAQYAIINLPYVSNETMQGQRFFVDEKLLNELKYCASFYSTFSIYFNRDNFFEEDEMKILIHEVEQLGSDIKNSSLDEEYKLDLLKIIDSLKKSFKEYKNYVDVSKVRKDLYELLGSICFEGFKGENNNEKKDIMRKIIKPMEVISSVLSIVSSTTAIADNIKNLIIR